MNTQSFSVRRPAIPSGLSIRPPSPGQLPLLPPKIVTPTIPNQSRSHATSPTHSTRSNSTHGRRASIETTRSGDGPPVPSKGEKDKRLPLPPWVSPSKRGEKGSYAGAYDNKLVSVYVNRAYQEAYQQGVFYSLASTAYTTIIAHANRKLVHSLESDLSAYKIIRLEPTSSERQYQKTTLASVSTVNPYRPDWRSRHSASGWYGPIQRRDRLDGRGPHSRRDYGSFKRWLPMERIGTTCPPAVWRRGDQILNRRSKVSYETHDK